MLMKLNGCSSMLVLKNVKAYGFFILLSMFMHTPAHVRTLPHVLHAHTLTGE